MAKYNVEIRDILSKIIVVEAPDKQQVETIAINNYCNANSGWVLDADNCIER